MSTPCARGWSALASPSELSRALPADTVRPMRACTTWVVVVSVVAGLAGGAAGALYTEADFEAKPFPVYTIPTPSGSGPTTVIGEPRMYRVRKGDTLMDLARLY